MKNIFNYLAVVAILFMGIMFASCSKDKDDASGSDFGSVSDNLIGWYANFNSVLSASDFDDINEAIWNEELMTSYRYGGSRHDHYATYDMFVDGDGCFSTYNSQAGRLSSSLDDYINVLHIVDNSTLVLYGGGLYEDNASGASGQTALLKIYAGPIFQNMTYYGTSISYRTYSRIDNKIFVSNGDIYTITSSGLIPDGSSYTWNKYDPSKRY